MTRTLTELAALVEAQDVLELGARASAILNHRKAAFWEDGSVWLALPDGRVGPPERLEDEAAVDDVNELAGTSNWQPGASPHPAPSPHAAPAFESGEAPQPEPEEESARPEAPRLLHLVLDPEESPQQAAHRLKSLKARFPGVPVHGVEPAWCERYPEGLQILAAQGLDSFSLFDSELAQDRLPELATLLYDQDTPVEELLDRLERLGRRPALASVLLLPSAPGDLILLRRGTTWGSRDVSLLAAARILLPGKHVRASWAALGWKLAQPTLAFGVDELSGWGMEEHRAYGGRVRPASRVGREEVEAGIREAARVPMEGRACGWVC